MMRTWSVTLTEHVEKCAVILKNARKLTDDRPLFRPLHSASYKLYICTAFLNCFLSFNSLILLSRLLNIFAPLFWRMQLARCVYIQLRNKMAALGYFYTLVKQTSHSLKHCTSWNATSAEFLEVLISPHVIIHDWDP